MPRDAFPSALGHRKAEEMVYAERRHPQPPSDLLAANRNITHGRWGRAIPGLVD